MDQRPNPDDAIQPDTKDWTWVVERPCPECGFDPASAPPEALPGLIEDASERLQLALERGDATVRTRPGVWSVVEYSQHMADVLEVMTQRLRAILDAAGADAAFESWDGDAVAQASEYDHANTHVTGILVKQRAAAAASAWAEPTGEQWGWTGVRSDGVRFTAAGLGAYLAHELVHHLRDVDA